ncbi:non-canonical poly(A) RNA polymerase PAPD5 isoform X1 [Ananas comosus]|uniref:polynucleotide adenylyltransferase n=1 Tax=Ananas comosus TaxID=4615 RepID=A0A6P5GIS6_ANACO|nr:non-canonical poly(A) RNA polymerase PAPD5 isoform X1 [Ananas comosus]
MDEGTPSFVYETLPALTLAPDDPAPGDPYPDPAGSYAVFRTEITAAAGPAADAPAADFFALDVSATATPIRDEIPPSPALTSSRAPEPPLAAAAASERAWFRAGCRFKSPMLQLHKEILDFCVFVSPTPEEQASRAAAVHSVFEVIKHIWPQCKVEVFGSFRTGLYLPTSDIDAVIIESKVKTPQVGLYALARALSQRSIAKKIQVIAKARVPIIKFVEKHSGIAFDISFDIDGGPKAADFIKDAVEKLPPLRPLCLILKVFLQQRELNEVYSGGIGSYGLLAMLIAHLQMQWGGQDLHSHHQSKEQNLGILLVHFFDFYGRKLNNWDVGISCNSKRTFFLKSNKGFMNSDRPYLLSIQDPQAPENDIGKNSYNYFKVKSAFSMAYAALTDASSIISLGWDRSILGTIIRPDPILLNRKGGKNGELTFSNLLRGAGEPTAQQFTYTNNVIYNWQLTDDEPLPRETLHAEDGSVLPSRKRRPSKSSQKSSKREKKDISQSSLGENKVKKIKKHGKGSRDYERVTKSLPRNSNSSRW